MSNKFYMAGGVGNCLFQLNYCSHLRQKGVEIEVQTFLLTPSWFLKLIGWEFHSGTLDFLHDIGALENVKLSRGNIFDVALLLLAKKFHLKEWKYKYIQTSENIEDCIPSAKCITGHPHHGVPVNEAFVKSVQSRLQSYRRKEYSSVEGPVVHIRGGDFLKSKIKGMALGQKYYAQIFKLFQNCTIITNDKTYVGALMKDFPSVTYSFSRASTVLDDFILLTSASELILSNSTFSWWAAELGTAETIYEPEFYYTHIDWRPNSLQRRITVHG